MNLKVCSRLGLRNLGVYYLHVEDKEQIYKTCRSHLTKLIFIKSLQQHRGYIALLDWKDYSYMMLIKHKSVKYIISELGARETSTVALLRFQIFFSPPRCLRRLYSLQKCVSNPFPFRRGVLSPFIGYWMCLRCALATSCHYLSKRHNFDK